MRWNEIVVTVLSLLIYFYLDHFFHFVQHPWIMTSLLIIFPLYLLVDFTIGIDGDWRKKPKITNIVVTWETTWRLFLFQWLRYFIQNWLHLNIFPSEQQVLNGLKKNDYWFIFSTKHMLGDPNVAHQMVMHWSPSMRFVSDKLKNDREWALNMISKKQEVFDDLPLKWRENKEFIVDACKKNKHLYTLLKLSKNPYTPSKSEMEKNE